MIIPCHQMVVTYNRPVIVYNCHLITITEIFILTWNNERELGAFWRNGDLHGLFSLESQTTDF
jgi:hypothetical protein